MKQLIAFAVYTCVWLSVAAGAHAQPTTQTFANPTLAAVRIHTADLDRSERYYREVFGLPEAQRYGEHERVLSLPGAGAPRITLIQGDQPRGNGGLALIVSDIDAVMRNAAASGGRVTREARAMNIGGAARIGFVEDPDGVSIEVIQVTGPPAQ